MMTELSNFAARLRQRIQQTDTTERGVSISDEEFNQLALHLFALQFETNSAYQKICRARNVSPASLSDWREIPAVPAAAFKELELTSLPREQRTRVFHSSGTTEQRPSRHFHNDESVKLYETSLLTAFHSEVARSGKLLILTPPPARAPNSSLVHMFETIRQNFGEPESVFVGCLENTGAWTIDFEMALAALRNPPPHVGGCAPLLILGTAFSLVHLLDSLNAAGVQLKFPPGSRVMETGGYKGRSRDLPKPELHRLITKTLGIPRAQIVCEYGMSELSSQAYDTNVDANEIRSRENPSRAFRFSCWARADVVSPETGQTVRDGETGLLRIFDLANVYSVLAIQTEDLAVHRGDCFELIGRAALAESRGCSLMAASTP